MKPDVHYARNGDVSLAYQVVGSGSRDLLLVSGFVSNLEYAWEYPSLSRFLSRLAETSRLILTDRRGSGLSDRFREAPTQETMFRDLEIVLDEVGSAKATLLGLWRVRNLRPVRGNEPRARRIGHPLQRFCSAEAGGGLPVGMDRRVLGRVAREHPRWMGDALLGREERTVDGSGVAR